MLYFQGLSPGGFNLGFLGSTCTALPSGEEQAPAGTCRQGLTLIYAI